MKVFNRAAGRPPANLTATRSQTTARVRVSVFRIHAIVTMTGAAVWPGCLMAQGASAVSVSKTAVSEPAFWSGYRWGLLAVIVLVVVQGMLIAALLVERRMRLGAECSNNEYRRELMHTSRLAVVGQLSASIAHEINQPLGAILSNADAADLMLAKAEPDLGEIRLILADIRNDGLRASEVVRQVGALARKRPLSFVNITVQELCNDILHFAVPVARRRGVSILTHFDSHALLVHGDPVLLRQAMLNLLLNAMDALVDVPEAQAVIELDTRAARPGEFEVTVRDHGSGVPEHYLGRLFDPFFTTRTHGLGLGLPIVRSIIESHGGRVLAENHPDGGAVFRFTIPAVDATSVASSAAEEPV